VWGSADRIVPPGRRADFDAPEALAKAILDFLR
jgi:hypothetical protein